MDMIDDFELSVLAETGDLEAAERVRVALEIVWEALCAVTGIPKEAIRGALYEP